jgi:hypothetical protein
MNRVCRQIVVCVVMTVGACSSGPAHVSEPAATGPVVVGGDRDEHGCIPSAGYQWCANVSACARPWELASERGFDNSAEAFAAFCGG